MSASEKIYTVYVLQCSDGSLYTGIASNLAGRLLQHEAGKGAKYVRSRRPFRLLYQESQPGRSKALIREAEIKSWTREDKILRLNLQIN